jgi:hypothetical protein
VDGSNVGCVVVKADEERNSKRQEAGDIVMVNNASQSLAMMHDATSSRELVFARENARRVSVSDGQTLKKPGNRKIQ